MSGTGNTGQAAVPMFRAHRDVWMALQALGRTVLSNRPARQGYVVLVCPTVRHRGAEQLVPVGIVDHPNDQLAAMLQADRDALVRETMNVV